MKRNVVLIGAGSIVFTTSLLADFIADGGEWELRLVDIDPDAATVAYKLAVRMMAVKKAPITVKKSTERREMLPGADIVITSLAVGGREAWEADIEIPRKYGIYMPVADTTTPGGIARSMRTMPVLVDIANDIRELCPAALFMNYANPMSAIVRAIVRYAGIDVWGLCDGPPGVRRHFAELLGVDESRCDFRAVGFNHFVWLTRWTVDGEDGFPLIREKNRQLAREGKAAGNAPDFPLAWELFDLTGFFPLSRDRHITEFFPQFYAHGKGRHYGRTLGVDRFDIRPFIQGAAEEFEKLRAIGEGSKPVPNEMFHEVAGGSGTARLSYGILKDLEKEKPGIHHVNIPNTGQVANLKRDLVVECPVEFSKNGAVPIQLGAIPTSILAFMEHAFVTTELIVEASMERDYRKFVEAIILDGCVSSVTEAKKLADELIAAHRKHLPGW
jgi:alpha-galactosidase